MLARMVPRIIVSHPVYNKFPEILGIYIPHANSPLQSRFKTVVIEMIKNISITLIVWLIGMIGVKDSIC
jgi:hypothetical protein